MKAENKFGWRNVHWAGLLLCAVITFRHVMVYIHGSRDISAPIVSALIYDTVFFILIGAAIYSLTVFLRMRYPKAELRFTALTLALAFILWVQGNLFLWNYGKLDGRPLQFERYHLQGVVEVVVWLLVLLIAWKMSRPLAGKAKQICLVLIVTQAIAAFHAYAEVPGQLWFKEYRVTRDRYYEYSRGKNVVIMILDASRSDIFQQIIDENPEFRKVFSGFTFFRNTTGTFNRTNPSMSGILTGTLYDNREPHDIAYPKLYTLPTSLPFVLKGEGFRTEIYPYNKGAVHLSPSIVDNLSPFGGNYFRARFLDELNRLWRIVHFNFSPHFLKLALFDAENIYDFGQLASKPAATTPAPQKKNDELSERFRRHLVRNRSVIERLENGVSLKVHEDLFRLIHFHGAHPPFFHDENYQDRKMPFSIASYKRQLQGALLFPKALITSLKRLGTFDDTLFILISDHGMYVPDGAKPSSGPLGSHEVDNNLALLMIKPFNAPNIPLKISSAPVSLFDVPATVFAALGLDTHGVGRPVFSVKEDENRTRFSYAVMIGQTKDSAGAILEYEVNGDAWDYTSWQPSLLYSRKGEGPLEPDEKTLTNLLEAYRRYLDNRRYDNH